MKFLELFKNVKELAIIGLVAVVLVMGVKFNNSLSKHAVELFNKEVLINNLVSDSSQFELDKDGLGSRLTKVLDTNSIMAEEIGNLEDAIEGQVVEITKLSLTVSEQTGSLDILGTKIDSLTGLKFTGRDGTKYTLFRQSWDLADSTENYTLTHNLSIVGTVNTYTNTGKVDNLYNDYTLKLKPVELILVTDKIDDFKYKVRTEVKGNFFEVDNVETIVAIENPYAPKPFFQRFDLGVGFGIDPQDQTAFGKIGFKYNRHMLGMNYGKNKTFEYTFFLRK